MPIYIDKKKDFDDQSPFKYYFLLSLFAFLSARFSFKDLAGSFLASLVGDFSLAMVSMFLC